MHMRQHVLSGRLAMQPVTRTVAGSRLEVAHHGLVAPKTPGIAALRARHWSVAAGAQQRAGSNNSSTAKRNNDDRSQGCAHDWPSGTIAGRLFALLQAHGLMSSVAWDVLTRTASLLRRLQVIIGPDHGPGDKACLGRALW